NEEPITRWRMARAMELCFFLLDRGRPMRKEQIIDALWPDAEDFSEQTLRSTIYYLRKALGEACIVSYGGTYALDVASTYGEHIWYDVVAFQKYSIQAKEALAIEEVSAASQAFQSMVDLYRGDYVQSFYSDWCTFRR